MFDIDEIFNEHDSLQRDFTSPSQKDGSDDEAPRPDTPPHPHGDDHEDEDAFMKRQQDVEEDEFVGRSIVNGVPDYSHFRQDAALPPVPGAVNRKEQEAMQKAVNNVMLRFCIMRVFRPDLLEEQTRDFIEVFLDSTLATQPAVNYMAIGRAAESQSANLLIKDGSIDV